MNRKLTLIALFLTFALTIAGCEEAFTSTGPQASLTSERQTVSVSQLAGFLGLRVNETTGTHITMRNAANTVMLFTYSGGKIYVNGRSIGQIGSITSTAGQTYVPRTTVDRIRAAMRTAPPTAVKPKPTSGAVVIDAGHGGKDPGATSCLGYYEKGVNLAVAAKVAAILKKRGVKTILTRSNDRFLELEQRAAISNRYNPNLFISVHSDSSSSNSARGFTLYVARSASWS